MAAAEAYLRGIERRIEAGLDPKVGSVASLFISRWDKGSADQLPDELHNRLGIAVGQQTYRAYRELLASERWNKLAAAGARPPRLLWARNGTTDPKAPAPLTIHALAATEPTTQITHTPHTPITDHRHGIRQVAAMAN